MTNEPPGHTPSTPARHHRSYPLHKVVAAVEPAATEQVAAALKAAGFAPDRIELVTAQDDPLSDEPIGGSGLRGFFARFGLSLGDDLDALEQARDELTRGHVLVFVMVQDDAERERVHAILREHGGHSMRYFGHWTITTLEGGVE